VLCLMGTCASFDGSRCREVREGCACIDPMSFALMSECSDGGSNGCSDSRRRRVWWFAVVVAAGFDSFPFYIHLHPLVCPTQQSK